MTITQEKHFIGTPEQPAEFIGTWRDASAIDGFPVMGSALPYEVTTFVDDVVTVLQQRNRFRTEYDGPTLRDQLGLLRLADR